MTEPLREWRLLAEFLQCGFRHSSECRSKEQARRDRHHANGKLGQIAGDRQGHSDDAAFGRGIRRLSDLTVEGSNTGGVDNDATLLADDVGAMQARGEFGNHVECSNQINIDDATKVCQRKGLPITVDGSNRLADTRAIDQDPCRSVRSDSGIEPGRYAVLVGNIDKKELAPYRSSDLSALVRVSVEDRNLRTQRRQAGGGGRTKARSTPCYNCRSILKIQMRAPWSIYTMSAWPAAILGNFQLSQLREMNLIGPVGKAQEAVGREKCGNGRVIAYP